jgi:hypothetical protein
MADIQEVVADELRTPRAAALAGIIFALVFGFIVLLLRPAIPSSTHGGGWILRPSHRHTLKLAIQLMPFAGIAFLWFIGVIRTRLGDREDKLFATAFLGSGLLFIAMLFAATGIVGGLLSLYSGTHTASPESTLLAVTVARFLIGTLGFRMAAVFTLVVTNLGLRTGVIPRWLVVLGFFVAAALFLVPPHIFWIALLFPVWVLLLSLHILVASFLPHPGAEGLDLAEAETGGSSRAAS